MEPQVPGIDESGSGRRLIDRTYLLFVLTVASYSLLTLLMATGEVRYLWRHFMWKATYAGCIWWAFGRCTI